MARSKFPVEVLTPEGQVFSDEVEMVSTRTTTGSIGILANHAPLMAILEPTELRLYKSESDVVRFAQGEGYLQVVENSALVLVEEAIPPDEVDSSAFESRLREAEDAMERAEEDSEERARAEREVRRYEAFLDVAGEGTPRERGGLVEGG
jgi:F-type H+-transporting ATPase subunit epsilon